MSNEIYNDEVLNPLSTIKNLRLSNVNRVVIGNLNINSLPNKFNQLKELVLKHVDILVLTETKLDDSFPNSQFLVDGFSEPFRIDRNRSGGGVMIYVRDVIPSKLLTKHFFPNDIEDLFVELNFTKCKLLLLGTYHLPSQSDQYFFENVDKALDMYSYYDKILQQKTLTQKYMTITWKVSFINMNLKVSLKKKLVLKASQTQVVKIYF